jgi:hypothetical protein
MDIAEFLLARIAEDEAAAGGAFRDVNDGSAPKFGMEWWAAGDTVIAEQTYVLEQDPGIGDTAVAEHVARWDPARVLIECEAKREVVKEWQEADRFRREYGNKISHAVLYPVLWALAQPWREHPDFDLDWRPARPVAVED